MIDVHCHILPGIDDGAKDTDTSLKMLNIAEQDGIEKIIVTPHYVRGMYDNDYDSVLSEIEKIKSIINEKGINIALIPGQEVYLDKYSVDLYKEGKIKGINGSSYVLCELPLDKLPDNAMDIIYELQVAGAKIILAHPERYMYFIQDLTHINDFIREDCLFQINSGSIRGIFGKEIKKTAKLLIKNGICDFVGSDAHSTGGRCPRIKDALEEAENYSRGTKERLIMNSCILLKDEEINIKHRKTYKKPRFLFYK